MIGILSVLGAIGSIAYVNSPGNTGSLAEVIVFWINFGIHLLLTFVWIISECMKCNANYKGHATSVLAFGIIYIFLFILDIATGIIMIVYGAYFVAAGSVSLFANSSSSSSYSSLTSDNLKASAKNA